MTEHETTSAEETNEPTGTAETAEPARGVCFVGVSLGRPGEPSGVVVLERFGDGPATGSFSVRYVRQYAPQTRYADIIVDLETLLSVPPLAHAGKQAWGYDSTVVLDVTGVGRGVGELFHAAKLAANVREVVVTGGGTVTLSAGREPDRVPKVEIVAAVQTHLQARRLKAPGASAGDMRPALEALVAELQNFRAKIATGPVAFEDWRDEKRPQQELVLALAVALWRGSRWAPKLRAYRF
jgi:hypothetical protein